MFHVELRQRPHLARAFNLSEAEVIARFLGPQLSGRYITYQDHEFDPRKLRVTVLEGPEIEREEMGLGRGWAKAQKTGTDVTERIVALAREQTQRPAGLDRLEERLLGRLDAGPIALGAVVGLADELLPGQRASARLALAELAVWELLHAGEVELRHDLAPLPAGEWQEQLLRWETWSPGPQATTSSISVARSSSVENR